MRSTVIDLAEKPAPPHIRRRRQWLIVGGVMVALLGAGVIIARPAPAPPVHTSHHIVFGMVGDGYVAYRWVAAGSKRFTYPPIDSTYTDATAAVETVSPNDVGTVTCSITVDSVTVVRQTGDDGASATCAWAP